MFYFSFKYEKSSINTTVLKTSGYTMGLSVVVKSDIDDYYYPLLPTHGLNVFIFRPHEYPDMYAGGLIQTDVPLRSEVFIKIFASKITAVPELKVENPIKVRYIYTSYLHQSTIKSKSM